MTKEILQVKDLQVAINTELGYLSAVRGVNFSISPKETLVLLGESGSGKTLTALAINQLLPETAAYGKQSKIQFKNDDLLKLSEIEMRKLRGNSFSMIFQEPMSALNPVFTIGQQISENFKQHTSLTGKQIKQQVIKLLNSVGIPLAEQRYDEYPHQLSGGMKQRVMIAMALAQEPELLIADEPTTALDVTIQYQILKLLKELQQQRNMAMIFITHDLGVAAEIADNIAVMYAGHIVEIADRNSFFTSPLHPYSQRLFDVLPDFSKRGKKLDAIDGSVPPLTQAISGCPFAPRCKQAWAHCFDVIPSLQIIDNQQVACHLYNKSLTHPTQEIRQAQVAEEISQTKTNDNQTLLRLNQLKVYYPIRAGILQRKVAEVKAVDGVSLEISPGKTIALVGESGCGKTTLGKAILGLETITGGTAEFAHHDLTTKRDKHIYQELQIIFQDPYASLNPRKTVYQTIVEGLKIHKIIDGQDKQQLVNQLLEAVGVPVEYQHRYPHEFSGGQRQRICIARALALKPKLIVCDEPTSGLDVSIQAQILNLLKRLQRQFTISYLFITHDISVVSYLADEVAVMYLGRIVEQGRVEDVLHRPQHPYTQSLFSAVLTARSGEKKKVTELSGEQPSPVNPPKGCHFYSRCTAAMDICKHKYPKFTQQNSEHKVACHLFD